MVHMQLKKLQVVLNHLIQRLRCPQCGGTFVASEMNVLVLPEEKIQCRVQCPKCKANVLIKGAVANSPAAPSTEASPLGKEIVTDISAALKAFDGENIEELFVPDAGSSSPE